jgi:hypothetical protein
VILLLKRRSRPKAGLNLRCGVQHGDAQHDDAQHGDPELGDAQHGHTKVSHLVRAIVSWACHRALCDAPLETTGACAVPGCSTAVPSTATPSTAIPTSATPSTATPRCRILLGPLCALVGTARCVILLLKRRSRPTAGLNLRCGLQHGDAQHDDAQHGDPELGDAQHGHTKVSHLSWASIQWTSECMLCKAPFVNRGVPF